ncbi:MAG: hypothetical protein ABIN36_02460 [Ferruginibacter sp.]
MRNLILFLLIGGISFISCKKSKPDKPAEGPSTGFALDYMEVEENLFGAYLYLYGNFGDSSSGSKVKVGNTLLDGHPNGDGVIVAWNSFYIKVSIGDPDDDTGAGFVSVINAGKETNKRMLNVWEISMLYTEPDEGTILKKVRFDAILRADANPHRSLFTFSPQSSFSSKSTAWWTIGGQGHASYTGGGNTISLEEHNGTVLWSKPNEDHTNEDNNFQSELKFKDGVFEITGLRMHKLDATLMSNLADGSTTPFITDYDFRVMPLPLNEVISLELDDNRAIKAGTYVTGPHGTQYDFTWDANEAPNHMHNFTLEWSKVEPRFNF